MKTISDPPPCPVCESTLAPLYTIDSSEPSFEIYQCPNCGLQMQYPLPDDPDRFYDDAYYSGDANFSYRDERKTERFDEYVWNDRLKTIAGHVPPPARLLDVGCSFGGFVRAAHRYGYQASGMDVSPFAVRAAREMGTDVQQGRPGEGNLPANHFDVITLIEVMEHLERPVESVQEFFQALRPGGLLVIQTANFAGRQAKRGGKEYHYYLPGHLFYYSTINLEMLLKKTGFERIRFYRGVDFGLLPKLLKSRSSFRTWMDYFRWWKISWYHWKSRIAWGHFALTSSMVVYARKPK